MSVFFFESLDKPIEEREKEISRRVLKAGGVIAFVIVGLGLIGLLLVVIRAFTLWQAGANSQKMVDELGSVIQKDGVAAAHKLVKEQRASLPLFWKKFFLTLIVRMTRLKKFLVRRFFTSSPWLKDLAAPSLFSHRSHLCWVFWVR